MKIDAEILKVEIDKENFTDDEIFGAIDDLLHLKRSKASKYILGTLKKLRYMRKFKTVRTDEFKEILGYGSDIVEDLFDGRYNKDEEILSFSEDGSVTFLTKYKIADIFAKFLSKRDIVYGLESTAFNEEYAEDFFGFLCDELNLGDDARWFVSMIDYVFELYSFMSEYRTCESADSNSDSLTDTVERITRDNFEELMKELKYDALNSLDQPILEDYTLEETVELLANEILCEREKKALMYIVLSIDAGYTFKDFDEFTYHMQELNAFIDNSAKDSKLEDNVEDFVCQRKPFDGKFYNGSTLNVVEPVDIKDTKVSNTKRTGGKTDYYNIFDGCTDVDSFCMKYDINGFEFNILKAFVGIINAKRGKGSRHGDSSLSIDATKLVHYAELLKKQIGESK